ncbi:hypothetical protein A2U01_0050424, partial [Trifolium medium]|nr:hypothetical protein [Trifolium medium]
MHACLEGVTSDNPPAPVDNPPPNGDDVDNPAPVDNPPLVVMLLTTLLMLTTP